MSSGWNYLQMPDPGPGLTLARVVRSDGKVLRVGDNVWTTDRSFPTAQTEARIENLLHLFDFGGTGIYTLFYRVIEETPTVLQAINGVDPAQFGPVASFDLLLSGPVDISTLDFHALTLTRNALVLDRGRVVHRGPSAALLDDPQTLHRLVAVA